MPFSALFWPDMPFNTPFLARKCRSILPNILLNIFACAGFSGQGAKKKSKTSRLTTQPAEDLDASSGALELASV
jgi:hypothetical protein